MKKTMVFVLTALLGLSAGAIAQEVVSDGPMSEYWQRNDGVTKGAGNAKKHNAAVHVIDPSPALARNRSIPGSGERLSRAIRRYQDVTKITEAARPITPEMSASGSSGGGSSGSSGSSSGK
jgi:hypothetical protein